MRGRRAPLVSVVIPTFNRAQPLLRAVASVLDQSYSRLQIIVVDDASTDASAALLVKHFGNRIELLRLPRNRGVSYARNRGIAFSRGDFIALLDSDDLWSPEKIARQLAFMREDPELLLSQTDEIWIRDGRQVNPRFRHRKPSGYIFAECLPLCVVSPSAVMMRRRFFARVGLFDENLPACEDYDLWLRTASRYPVPLLAEKLVVKHGGHADQLSRTVPALDRYRIQALLKVLHSGTLTKAQREMALAVLQEKSAVYLAGCRKRGRQAEIYQLQQALRDVAEPASKA
ncbi:MAG TPA: glycosyltransferase [Proteobacteria bacterium]|nr:glycosyltransferase [Pseudomonadota bacterium]